MDNSSQSCKACKNQFSASSEFCINCGCPANANDSLIRGWIRSFSEPPQKPTKRFLWRHEALGFRGWFADLFISKCPRCSKFMYIYDSICPHCEQKLELTERHELVKHYNEKMSSGHSIGLLFFVSLFVLVIIFTYVADNF